MWSTCVTMTIRCAQEVLLIVELITNEEKAGREFSDPITCKPRKWRDSRISESNVIKGSLLHFTLSNLSEGVAIAWRLGLLRSTLLPGALYHNNCPLPYALVLQWNSRPWVGILGKAVGRMVDAGAEVQVIRWCYPLARVFCMVVNSTPYHSSLACRMLMWSFWRINNRWWCAISRSYPESDMVDVAGILGSAR